MAGYDGLTEELEFDREHDKVEKESDVSRRSFWLLRRCCGWPPARAAAGNTAVLRYGDPQVEQRIDLRKNADYDIDTGLYTIHLHVENGGIAFVNSPCPDHTCEGFGVLKNAGRLGRVYAGKGKFDDRIR